MTRTIATLAATLLAGTAFAATVAELDANGDGMVTVDELQMAYPDLTAETFTALDINADGALDDAELQAAVDAGTLE